MSELSEARHHVERAIAIANETGETIRKMDEILDDMRVLVSEMPTLDCIMSNDASHSTALERASRYLVEVLTASIQYGLTFTIQGEETPLCYALFTAFTDQVSVYNVEARTPVMVAATVAQTIAELLEAAINDDTDYSSTWTNEVFIRDGMFIDNKTGEVLADNAQQMAEFLENHLHMRIKIVPSYD